jgi:hypothetical protein
LAERLVQFLDGRFTLDRGAHLSFESGHCATEAGAWLAGEQHSDRPSCISPVLAQFLRTFNDHSTRERRQSLKPYVVRAIGTAGDGRDESRDELCRAWLVGDALPLALGLAGRDSLAASMRAQRNPPAPEDVLRRLRQARSETWAARDHAYRSVCRTDARAPAEICEAGRASAQAAARAAAAAAAAAAVVATDVPGVLSGFPADAGSYADAASVAAAGTLASFADAAASATYVDAVAQPGAAHATSLTAIADRLHGDGLQLLDRMLPE